MNKTALISLTVIGLSSSLHLLDAKSSQAATVFSSLAAFEAALSGPSTVIDDYNGTTNLYNFFDTPLDRGVYTLTNEVGEVFFNAQNGNVVDGTPHMVIHGVSPSGITFSFDDPISAIGFDYQRNHQNPSPVDVQVTANGFSDVFTAQRDTPGFFGVIFDAPVSSLTILKEADTGFVQIGIDNLRTGVPAAVPEPLTILGAGTALGFGTFFKRKVAKKAKKSSKV